MKINLDLNKVGKTALNFVKDNPILCIGTCVVGYITLRDHFLLKSIRRDIKDLKENDLVKETINRMK
jgi:hypothetical protein